MAVRLIAKSRKTNFVVRLAKKAAHYCRIFSLWHTCKKILKPYAFLYIL